MQERRKPASAAQGYSQIMLLVRGYRDSSDGLYYLESPHLDLIRAGATPEEARAVFGEAVEILLRGWRRRDALEARLAELGFERDVCSAGDGTELVTFVPPATRPFRLERVPKAAELRSSTIQTIRYRVPGGTPCLA